jgi:GH43 family beta-xylosidase
MPKPAILCCCKGRFYFSPSYVVIENESPYTLEGTWIEKGQIKTDWDSFSLLDNNQNIEVVKKVVYLFKKAL